jgi:hypothetical protein
MSCAPNKQTETFIIIIDMTRPGMSKIKRLKAKEAQPVDHPS